MAENFDLFGDPIPDWKGKRGRPPHEPSDRTRNKIKLLLALGWVNSRIANALGITEPTLRKHYFSELKFRDEMRDRLDARRFEIAMEQANAGNVAALKELGKLIETSDLMVRPRQPVPTEPKKEKLGKKEQAMVDARDAHKSTRWGNLLQ